MIRKGALSGLQRLMQRAFDMKKKGATKGPTPEEMMFRNIMDLMVLPEMPPDFRLEDKVPDYAAAVAEANAQQRRMAKGGSGKKAPLLAIAAEIAENGPQGVLSPSEQRRRF